MVVNNEALGGALGFRASQVVGNPGPALVALLVAGLLFTWFEMSWLRRAAATVKEDAGLAASPGIEPRFVIVSLPTAAGFVAGAAGALYLHSLGIIDPALYGFDNSLRIVLFALVGGPNVFFGAALAGAAPSVVPEVLRFTAAARMLLYGGVLVGVVLLRPDGLLPRGRVGLRPLLLP